MNEFLTDEEKSIASVFQYDPLVLLKIKEVLNPQMGIVKVGGLETPDRSFLSEESAAQPNQVSRESAIAALEATLEGSALALSSPEKAKRVAKISALLKEYNPILRQETLDKHLIAKGKGFLELPADSLVLESDEATDKFIADIKEFYKDKSLRPENKRKAVLALKFKKPGDHIDSALNGTDPRLTSLNNELESKGYRLYPERDILMIRDYETEKEALDFLQAEGKTPTRANFQKVQERPSAHSETENHIKYRATSFRKVALLKKIDQEETKQ